MMLMKGQGVACSSTKNEVEREHRKLRLQGGGID